MHIRDEGQDDEDAERPEAPVPRWVLLLEAIAALILLCAVVLHVYTAAALPEAAWHAPHQLLCEQGPWWCWLGRPAMPI